MKPLLVLATACALGAPLPAQVQCTTQGVTVSVTPDVAPPGTPFVVTITNNSAATVFLPTPCVINAVYTGSNCIGGAVFIPFCPSVLTAVDPGNSLSMAWNQFDDYALQVPVGGYSIETIFWDAGFTMLSNCCLPIEISGYVDKCDGDGGNQMGCTNCPCGNNALPGTTGGCLNPEGRSARLHGSGVPSVAADSMRFEVTGASSLTFGILVAGTAVAPNNPANPCFGLDSGVTSNVLDGLRCAVGTTIRYAARSTDANGDIGTGVPGPGQNAWGPPSGPPGGLIATSGFTAGQSRTFQCFYRTNAAAGCLTGQNTSQSTSVTIVP